MKLSRLVHTYVSYKQALGIVFHSEETVLKSFCRRQGNVGIDKVTAPTVLAFLQGNGLLTATWHRKFDALSGFYRFAISRGYTKTSPLPVTKPKRPPSCGPYIYSREELQKLLEATTQLKDLGRRVIPPEAFRVLLLFLYGTGLRLSEALDLTCADVDIESGLLTIRCSKFYKSRLVPVGPQLRAVLASYAKERRRRPLRQGENSVFFATYRGKPFHPRVASLNFERLRTITGIKRGDTVRRQPCFHDLRHTFTVHRLVSWYRTGADVQRLLPYLSTYLGHRDIRGTQRYLTMTPELLKEANSRFERYALTEVTHVK